MRTALAPVAAPASAFQTSLLRVLTCGSVDDGKSTLVGRLLLDAGLVPDDHLAALRRDSRGRPCGPEGLDLSLLADGLEAEREQGITIDVAYRYFATGRRAFILADSPGHEQYTRNMATAASNVDAALVLIDARKGLLPQTRRHTAILSLLGVTRVAAVVNKMDLVEDDEATFRQIARAYEAYARSLGIAEVTSIPVSALRGDNVVRPGGHLRWHRGSTLMDWLDGVEAATSAAETPFRMPVQWVNRPNADFRGLSGMIVGGRIRPGDEVVVAGTSRRTKVRRIVTMEGDLDEAVAGLSVTLVLADDLDAGRGDVLASPERPPAFADQFAAHLVWFGEEPMVPGRSYLMRLGTAFVPAAVTDLKHRLDVNTLEHLAAKTLQANEVGLCNVAADRPLVFEAYRESRELGGFVLIDRLSNTTVGAGTIEFALRRATNLHWQAFDTSRATRAGLKGQRPAIVWLTGLSGAGKSTLANIVERKLSAAGRHAFVLDGDNVRHGLNRDLGFTEADRVENVRRVAEVARLMADAGLIVLVSLISPFRRERLMAREIAGDVSFLEVFIDAPLQVCEERDPKGLYARARAGLIRNFTGIDSAYEAPEQPDLRLHSAERPAEDMADEVLQALMRIGCID